MTTKLSHRRQAGATSLRLPPMGFGAAHLGGMYNRVSGETAHATLKAAWDNGIRFFDTAPYYGRGLSEHRVGDFLIDKPRDEFVITTKVGRYFKRPADPRNFDRTPWGGGLNMEIVWDYSYDGILRAYEQSLLRLGLDTVDALLIHDPEAAADPNGPKLEDLTASGYKALEELKRSGQIKAIGMGLNAAPSLATIAPLVPLDFCIVAMPYTLLDQTALTTGLKRCVDENISVIIGAPYASGILATGPGPNARYRYGIAEPDIQDKTRRIQAVCARHGVSLQAAALQFPLAHPAVVSVIPGGARPEEVTANIGFIEETIPAALWSDLRNEGLIDPEAPTPG
ncbi:MAG: aldo/keto reductase [Devosia sp.]|uniref:aldo/keto reductase n=1 Tax=Devosia sp. TaxID=1871048 RepID=UPI001AC90F51|nr:aldo/keto reductase [Devosia sp.]MBN9315421.1 aldo/keto reductase [Devosia sp.]